MQTGVPRIMSTGDQIVVENQEIVLSVSGSAAAGLIAASGFSTRLEFVNSTTAGYLNTTKWITKLAVAYDKWRFESLELYFVPSLPVTTSGMYAMFFDSDPVRASVPGTVAAASGDMRAVSRPIYGEARLKVTPDQLNRLPQYETLAQTAPSATASQGTVVFVHDSILLSNGAAAGAVAVGNVWMKYRIRFFNPSNAE